jgi:hypothetical protein
MKWFCIAILAMFVANSAVNAQIAEPCMGPTSCGSCDNAEWKTMGPYYITDPINNVLMACPWYAKVKELNCPDGTKVICSILMGPVRDTSFNADCEDLFTRFYTGGSMFDAKAFRVLENRAYLQFLAQGLEQTYLSTPEFARSKYECPNGSTSVQLVATSCAWGAPVEGEIFITPIDKIVGDKVIHKGDKISVPWEGIVWTDCESQHCCKRFSKICWDKNLGKAVISETLYTPDNEKSCGSFVNTNNNPPDPKKLPPGCRYVLDKFDVYRCEPNCNYVLEEYKP